MRVALLLLLAAGAVTAQISADMFRHHFIAREMPGRSMGAGSTALLDCDGEGGLDIVSKIWSVWKDNGNEGRVHVDWLENLRQPRRP